MGYFANGTEGESYEERFCDHCLHQKPEDGGCPIWLLHMLWNYDAVGSDADEVKAAALGLFIPRDEQGHNAECTMFTPAPKLVR